MKAKLFRIFKKGFRAYYVLVITHCIAYHGHSIHDPVHIEQTMVHCLGREPGGQAAPSKRADTTPAIMPK